MKALIKVLMDSVPTENKFDDAIMSVIGETMGSVLESKIGETISSEAVDKIKEQWAKQQSVGRGFRKPIIMEDQEKYREGHNLYKKGFYINREGKGFLIRDMSKTHIDLAINDVKHRSESEIRTMAMKELQEEIAVRSKGENFLNMLDQI